MIHDFAGKEIVVGCKVAYAMRRGARMWLSQLNVMEIVQGPGGVCLRGFSPTTGRYSYTRNPQNCVVIR